MVTRARVLGPDLKTRRFVDRVDPDQGTARPLADVELHPVQVREILHVALGPRPGLDPTDAPAPLFGALSWIVVVDPEDIDVVVVAHQCRHLDLAHVGHATQVEERLHDPVAIGLLRRAAGQNLDPAHQLLDVRLGDLLTVQVPQQVEVIGVLRTRVAIGRALELPCEAVRAAEGRGIRGVQAHEGGPQVTTFFAVDVQHHIGDDGAPRLVSR